MNESYVDYVWLWFMISCVSWWIYNWIVLECRCILWWNCVSKWIFVVCVVWFVMNCENLCGFLQKKGNCCEILWWKWMKLLWMIVYVIMKVKCFELWNWWLWWDIGWLLKWIVYEWLQGRIEFLNFDWWIHINCDCLVGCTEFWMVVVWDVCLWLLLRWRYDRYTCVSWYEERFEEIIVWEYIYVVIKDIQGLCIEEIVNMEVWDS